MSLDDIRDAIAGADREAVEALLNAEDSDLDAFSVNALFGMCVLAAAQYDAVARAPDLANDEHYVAAKRLIKGVIAAGSYKKYLRLPLQELLNLLSLAQRGKLTHRSVLRLRSLVSRGRATLRRRRSRRRARGSDAQAEHAITFLIKLGDNGIVWNILSFWKETN